HLFLRTYNLTLRKITSRNAREFCSLGDDSLRLSLYSKMETARRMADSNLDMVLAILLLPPTRPRLRPPSHTESAGSWKCLGSHIWNCCCPFVGVTGLVKTMNTRGRMF